MKEMYKNKDRFRCDNCKKLIPEKVDPATYWQWLEGEDPKKLTFCNNNCKIEHIDIMYQLPLIDFSVLPSANRGVHSVYAKEEQHHEAV